MVPNEATGKGYAFGKEQPLMADGAPIQAPGGDAGPFAADWDGDGKLDLLVGAGDGSVWFYRNVGTATAPKLAKGVQLVPPGENRYGEDAPKEPRRGTRAKVCAVDLNGDGRFDLLVGDYTTQRPNRPDPTPEEKAGQGTQAVQRGDDPVQPGRSPLYGPGRAESRHRKGESRERDEGPTAADVRACASRCHRSTNRTAGCGCSAAGGRHAGSSRTDPETSRRGDRPASVVPPLR
ncbi:MAG: VCBS repeat-containing protein [Gemmataceae bacterium]